VHAELDDQEMLSLHLTTQTTLAVTSLTVEFSADRASWGEPLRVTLHGYRRQDRYRRLRDRDLGPRHLPEQVRLLVGKMQEVM
jgi:hypothetical protein